MPSCSYIGRCPCYRLCMDNYCDSQNTYCYGPCSRSWPYILNIRPGYNVVCCILQLKKSPKNFPILGVGAQYQTFEKKKKKKCFKIYLAIFLHNSQFLYSCTLRKKFIEILVVKKKYFFLEGGGGRRGVGVRGAQSRTSEINMRKKVFIKIVSRALIFYIFILYMVPGSTQKVLKLKHVSRQKKKCIFGGCKILIIGRIYAKRGYFS